MLGRFGGVFRDRQAVNSEGNGLVTYQGVENGLHCTLDVQSWEGDCCMRTGNSPTVMEHLAPSHPEHGARGSTESWTGCVHRLLSDCIGSQWILAPSLPYSRLCVGSALRPLSLGLQSSVPMTLRWMFSGG